MQKLVHANVTLRLDYSNSLLFTPKTSLKSLQGGVMVITVT